jgi:hypothetical protein
LGDLRFVHRKTLSAIARRVARESRLWYVSLPLKRSTMSSVVALATIQQVAAIILFSTDDPSANTTEPTADLAGSGWQFEGNWGGVLGTPIAPHFFASAAHVGGQGTFIYQGETYTIVRGFNVPGTDLQLWQVVETFPNYAALYTKRDEVGKPFVVIGRGTQRGAPVSLNNQLHGWYWGPVDGVWRWGQNVVDHILVYQFPQNELLVAPFDQAGLTNEAILSSGDSGGAVFINDGGTWKLAGINFAVDGPFYTDAAGSGEFNAALFDARGFYQPDGGGQYVLIDDPQPVPASTYATRISAQIAAIYSITDPSGDADHDGISNLLEYAMHLDALVPDANGLPTIERSGDTVSLVYRKNDAASDLTYSVEQSSDLTTWTTAQTTDQVLSDTNGTKTIRATISGVSASRLFLRLRVTRP